MITPTSLTDRKKIFIQVVNSDLYFYSQKLMNRVQQPCERNWCPKKGIVFAGSYGSEINPMSRFIRLFIIIENKH